MPVLKRPDGEIHYQTFGKGFPVLLFAPGGLRSRMEMWPAPAGGPPRPWVDWTAGAAGGRLHRGRHGPAQRRRLAHCDRAPIMAGTPMPPTTSR